ncbi:MMPL family transporter [Dactylosporangium matsuzakiense]|uniref:MMPL family transporter n=1 Tax=Dactylosporangium matsuzakiense TaxID=53360 RepID=UPI0021C45090|nr:MMPL family transporter [Dactylosporangium matsuzakiense]UWZ41918.1 MMPL family transporter [Dactylosporangium matsuzakiense]
MLYRYGTFIHRRARLILVVSLLLLLGAGIAGAGVFGRLQGGGFDDPASESSKAQQLIDERFGGRPNLVLLARAADGSVDSVDAAAAGATLTADLKGEAGVSDVVSYWSAGVAELKSGDGRDAIVLAHVGGDETARRERAQALIERYAVDGSALSVRAGGEAAVNVDVNTQVARSLAIAEAIAVPLTLLLLIIVFGSVVSALLPLAVGGVAIVGTFAELSLLGAVTDVSVFAINLTTALGLGLGIDYALLMVSRFREQLGTPGQDGGTPVAEALAATVATAGRTILFAAATVATALTALLVFPLYFLRSFAYAGIGVVVIAAVGALVVLPALLAVLGRRVEAGRVPWRRTDAGPAADSPFWGRLAGAVMRRPALAALPVVLGLLVAASPLAGVRFGTPDEGVLRPGSDGRVVADRLATGFASNQNAGVDVVLDGAVNRDALTGYAAALSTLEHVGAVTSSAGIFAGGAKVRDGDPNLSRPDGERLAVATNLTAKSDDGQALVRAVRAAHSPVPAYVGGTDARLIDTTHAISSRLPFGVAVVVLATFALLFLFTGSVIQPLRALVLNVLGLSATMGVLTWIFQDGHLAPWLQFTPRPMDTAMTVLMFCIVFGLSMDYEVFLIGRIAELHGRGLPTDEAVRTGLARTGRIVSAAAMLLAVSFFAFGTSTVSFLQMFGIGCGLAIIVDATLIRGILVPAIVRGLGRLNWYSPAPLRRIHTKVALSEA